VTESRGLHRGVVSEFDEQRGLGIVVGDDGARYPFHCTQIGDGSRRIDMGSRVVFTCAPGHLGRMEARNLMVLSRPVP
jgi:cold shock CspA family protein